MKDKRSVLVHSPNWLGDVIMAFPAFRLWRNANMDADVYIIAKKSVANLWNYVSDVSGIITIGNEKGDMGRAAAEIRKAGCSEAVVLPQSFRSAFQVWRGGVRSIRGTAGQFRSFFITDEVSLDHLESAHQAFEYMHIFGLPLPEALSVADVPSPSLAVDKTKLPDLPDFGVNLHNSLVILPGAARGDSKRWPPEYFAAAATSLLDAYPEMNAVICGTPTEEAECNEVAALLGKRAFNLCGKTRLPELAKLISLARVVCCNDSGGMHLSTAVNTPVAAVFGITDPSKTGPLGKARVVAAEGFKVSRAIPRSSETAVKALRSVKPERVAAALEELIQK